MKKFIKKIATLGLASIMLGTTLGVSGCNSTEDGVADPEVFDMLNSKLYKEMYIVVTENGSETLHKGRAYTEVSGAHAQIGSPVILEFDCGEKLQTSQYVGYIDKCPKPDKYDQVCDCAYEPILSDTSSTQSKFESKKEDYELCR